MNYKTLFYLLTVADRLSVFLLTIAIITSILFVIIFGIRGTATEKTADENKELVTKASRWMKTFLLITIPCWFLYLAIPERKDIIMIVAAGQTLDYLSSDSTAKKLPSEFISFISTEIKSLKEEITVKTVANEVKSQVLEEAKKLTGEQLIEKLQSDTTLKNIILSK